MAEEIVKQKNSLYKKITRSTDWLLIIAVIGSVFVGGIIQPIAYVAGLSGIYYTYKERNNSSVSSNRKIIRVVLIVLWLIIVGVTNGDIGAK